MTDDYSYDDESNKEESEAAADGAIQLTFQEARVLGCLIEKEATTPDNYPLTLNSLHSACNQSSNRDPVTDLGTDEVEDALETLRLKKLALMVRQAGARVPKYKHTIENEFPYLKDSQRALLCVLFLRGQQTVGELRQRTQRMHPFADIERTQNALDELKEFQPDPLVKEIPAGGGHRVPTFVHLLGGGVEIDASHEHAVPAPASTPPPSAATHSTPAPVASAVDDDWKRDLEQEVETLKQTVSDLQADVDQLKRELGM